MCSYNAVNGIPSCANKAFLTGILREEWGFEGVVTSDCGAVDTIMTGHNYTHTPSATVAAALKAGVDLDCGGFMKAHLPAALADGSVSPADVDAALLRLLIVQVRLGLLDGAAASSPYNRIPADAVHSPAHLQLALEAAQQAMVLLKNTNATLPLSLSFTLNSGGQQAKSINSDGQQAESINSGLRIAVVGPNANDTQTLMSDYFGVVGLPPHIESPLAAIQRYARAAGASAGENNHASTPDSAHTGSDAGGSTWGGGANPNHVAYEEGCTISGAADPTAMRAAEAAAAAADVTILFLGLNQTEESEDHDRVSLTLPGAQDELLSRVATVVGAAHAKRLILVVLSGGAVDLSFAKKSPHVSAIIWAGYGGEFGGTAIADALFGTSVSSVGLWRHVFASEGKV
jgi:hypothetical protein